MKYYIIAPQFLARDKELEQKIREADKDAEFTENMSEADTCVLQKSWYLSPKCANRLAIAKSAKKKCCEAKEYFR